MKIIRIRGKLYKWDIEDMNDTLLWVVVGSIMAITVVSLWCMLTLPVVLL